MLICVDVLQKHKPQKCYLILSKVQCLNCVNSDQCSDVLNILHILKLLKINYLELSIFGQNQREKSLTTLKVIHFYSLELKVSQSFGLWIYLKNFLYFFVGQDISLKGVTGKILLDFCVRVWTSWFAVHVSQVIINYVIQKPSNKAKCIF